MACDSIQNSNGIISNVAVKTEFTSLRVLPPAKEVWGKVMCLNAMCLHVCHSLYRRVGFPACIIGHMTRWVCLQGDGLHPWGSAFKGVCIQGRGLGRTPPPPQDTWHTMGYGQQMGGTHRT